MNAIGKSIEEIYMIQEGSEDVEAYHQRHGTQSLCILTVCDKRSAMKEAESLLYEIYGKTVIEIGAGVGLLAIYMARVAKHVYAIEVDPAWSWAFTRELYRKKPENLTWIFGTAESVAPWLRGDVAIIYTRSGQGAMESVAKRMCPKTVWGPRT